MKRVQEYLRKRKLHGALFRGVGEEWDPTIRYFTGFDGMGFLWIPAKGKSTLLTYSLEATRAKKYHKNVKVINKPLNKLLNLKGKKIGIEFDKWSVPRYKNGKFKGADITEFTRSLRAVKSKKELQILKHACKETSSIFTKLIKNWSFKTEADVAAWIDYEIKKRGGQPGYNTIVASGKNGAMPHYTPKNVKLQKGFCVMDFGMRYEGYTADLTRTIFLGKPKKEHQDAYEAIQKAHKASYKEAKPGNKTSKVHKAAEKALGKRNKYFIHSVGHGIGLEIHESPSVGPGSKDILKEGMVITIEPGIYYPNKFGIRLEDDLVIIKKGASFLTSAKRDLISL